MEGQYRHFVHCVKNCRDVEFLGFVVIVASVIEDHFDGSALKRV